MPTTHTSMFSSSVAQSVSSHSSASASSGHASGTGSVHVSVEGVSMSVTYRRMADGLHTTLQAVDHTDPKAPPLRQKLTLKDGEQRIIVMPGTRRRPAVQFTIRCIGDGLEVYTGSPEG